MTGRPIAALFVRADSIYKTMPGVDCWDEARDARAWPGGVPVVAHPPCKRWSMINGVVLSRYPHKAAEFAWGNDGGLFKHALGMVRRWGGVIEHPAGSRAFDHYLLPRVGRGPDQYGGWVCEVRQCDWGHRAEKRTWLYIVGAEPDDLPVLPPPGAATARCCHRPVLAHGVVCPHARVCRNHGEGRARSHATAIRRVARRPGPALPRA